MKAILYYGDLLEKNNWNSLKVPIEQIKSIKPSHNGYNKITIEWNHINYHINMFNEIKFVD